MVGNSAKSDIIPVLELGGYAVHLPFHTTWVHEEATYAEDNPRLLRPDRITDIPDLLP